MKAAYIAQLISNAVQGTVPHTFIASDLEEANAQLQSMATVTGLIVILDTAPPTGFEYRPGQTREFYTLRLIALLKQADLDTPRNEIDAGNTTDGILQAFADAVATAVPTYEPYTAALSQVYSEKALFDDNFGGSSATLTFTRFKYPTCP